MAADPRTPVLVGAAQYVDRAGAPGTALSPLAMLEHVTAAALAEAGVGAAALDGVAVVRMFADSAPVFASPFGTYANLPRALANRLGATPQRCLYGPVGGNTPQQLINLFASEIAQGHHQAVVIAGCEALRTQALAQKQGLALDWSDDSGDAPESLGPEKMMISAAEMAHQMTFPVNVYPLFENALAAHYRRTPVAQRAHIGDLMARFSHVAAHNPFAMLPVARTADEIITPTEDNRYIGYPYTKYLNANMFVDQAAAVVMVSSATADRLNIPHAQRIYLHGCADTQEKWHVSARVNYHSSPAIKVGAAHALAMADITVGDLTHIDLYSCFSSAVQIAADEIGLAHDDARGLTLTGGLPYFGGAGNNYSLHAIAEVVARCRRGGTGFVFANGGYLTKHSFGVYSAATPAQPFARVAPDTYQVDIDRLPTPVLDSEPAGAGVVETCTVIHAKGAPAVGIVIGRLATSNARFLSLTRDPAMMAQMIDQPVIGRAIVATPGQPANGVAFAG